MLQIITISLEDDESLSDTLKSIERQQDTRFQIIICTPEARITLPESLKSKTIVLKDIGSGIYAAMNQCIEAASTGHIMFLNAGDTLFNSNVTATINKRLESDRTIKGQVIVTGFGKMWLLPESASSHQSCVFFHDHQCPIFYDENKAVYADGEYIWENRSKYLTKYISQPLVTFALGGVSNNYNLRLVRIAYRECGLKAAISVLIKVVLQLILGKKNLRQLIYFFKGIERI